MQDLNECVGEVMRFMLASNTKKPSVPVTYTALAARLKELQSRKTKIATVVIQHAQKKFTTFGWEMAQLGNGAACDPGCHASIFTCRQPLCDPVML
jgi:hypothetical protein